MSNELDVMASMARLDTVHTDSITIRRITRSTPRKHTKVIKYNRLWVLMGRIVLAKTLL